MDWDGTTRSKSRRFHLEAPAAAADAYIVMLRLHAEAVVLRLTTPFGGNIELPCTMIHATRGNALQMYAGAKEEAMTRKKDQND